MLNFKLMFINYYKHIGMFISDKYKKNILTFTINAVQI